MPITNILVVDDSPTDRAYLSDLLSKNGFKVSTAESAEDCMAKVKQLRPDLVLMDVIMPGQNGFQATRALSKDETTIGRAESCDLGLFGANPIERLHARIRLKNNRYLLDDAETPGGTYLNDERIISPTPLRSGDKIRVCNAVIEFGERQKRK